MNGLFIAAALAAALPVNAAMADGSYPLAQGLADRMVARNSGMIDTIMHVSPADGGQNIVIAAHLRKANGEASGADDLGVAATGAPLIEIQKDGVRLGILVQMRDAGHRPIGALGLMYAYQPGDDIEARVRQSFAVRDSLARQIASKTALVSG